MTTINNKAVESIKQVKGLDITQIVNSPESKAVVSFKSGRTVSDSLNLKMMYAQGIKSGTVLLAREDQAEDKSRPVVLWILQGDYYKSYYTAYVISTKAEKTEKAVIHGVAPKKAKAEPATVPDRIDLSALVKGFEIKPAAAAEKAVKFEFNEVKAPSKEQLVAMAEEIKTKCDFVIAYASKI